MPDVLWPIFNNNRALLADLSAIGAKAIESWIEAEHGVQVCIMVVAHTFGRHLNFNSHLHILVSTGGFRESEGAWIPQLNIRKASLSDFWRDSVIGHLRLAQGKLISPIDGPALDQMLIAQGNRRWRTHHKEFGSKYHFLQYAARYLRRPPLAEYRFQHVGEDEIVFRTHDHRLKREVLTHYSPSDFIRALTQQVPERYRHCVRYFGLLAPRTKARCMGAILTILGQARRPRPARLSWALSIKREFGVDPLVDRMGKKMQLIARRAAVV
ncbi:MAG TPA: transposase [Candidatus Aquilonibacter sp.]|nr:transposase [Candidatus Aquilonibacter sp.]